MKCKWFQIFKTQLIIVLILLNSCSMRPFISKSSNKESPVRKLSSAPVINKGCFTALVAMLGEASIEEAVASVDTEVAGILVETAENYRKVINYEQAVMIKNLNSQKRLEEYLQKLNVPLPKTAHQKIAFFIAIAEAFGVDKMSLAAFSRKNTAENFVNKMKKIIGSNLRSDNRIEIDASIIQKVAKELFLLNNPDTFKVSTIMGTTSSSLSQKVLYQYYYKSIVEQDILSNTKSFLFFKRGTAEDLYQEVMQKSKLKKLIHRTFKLFGNSWKLVFGKGRKNIFLDLSSLPSEFIELVHTRGLRYAFKTFEHEILPATATQRGRQLVWAYISTAFVFAWIAVGVGITLANIKSHLFSEQQLEIDLSSDASIEVLLYAWQVSSYELTNIWFSEYSQEYQQAREDLIQLQKEPQRLEHIFKEDHGLLEYKEERLSGRTNELVTLYLKLWQRESMELNGKVYDESSPAYVQKKKFLLNQTDETLKDIIQTSFTTIAEGFDRRNALFDIMAAWERTQTEKGIDTRENEADYMVAYKYYEGLSTRKLQKIWSSLSQN